VVELPESAVGSASPAVHSAADVKRALDREGGFDIDPGATVELVSEAGEVLGDDADLSTLPRDLDGQLRLLAAVQEESTESIEARIQRNEDEIRDQIRKINRRHVVMGDIGETIGCGGGCFAVTVGPPAVILACHGAPAAACIAGIVSGICGGCALVPPCAQYGKVVARRSAEDRRAVREVERLQRANADAREELERRQLQRAAAGDVQG